MAKKMKMKFKLGDIVYRRKKAEIPNIAPITRGVVIEVAGDSIRIQFRANYGWYYAKNYRKATKAEAKLFSRIQKIIRVENPGLELSDSFVEWAKKIHWNSPTHTPDSIEVSFSEPETAPKVTELDDSILATWEAWVKSPEAEKLIDQLLDKLFAKPETGDGFLKKIREGALRVSSSGRFHSSDLPQSNQHQPGHERLRRPGYGGPTIVELSPGWRMGQAVPGTIYHVGDTVREKTKVLSSQYLIVGGSGSVNSPEPLVAVAKRGTINLSTSKIELVEKVKSEFRFAVEQLSLADTSLEDLLPPGCAVKFTRTLPTGSTQVSSGTILARSGHTVRVSGPLGTEVVDISNIETINGVHIDALKRVRK